MLIRLLADTNSKISRLHFVNMRKVVLLSTHIINNFVLQKYRRLYNDLHNSDYDVVLLLNMEEEYEYDIPDDIVCFTTNSESINELGYEPIEETLLPGSCHFPVLRFFIDNPEYHHYWFIEYDVEFTGKWDVLMNDCDTNLDGYDFLSCHIERFDETNKDWGWWHHCNDSGYPLTECIKGFNPICRYSNKALDCLNKYLKQGYSAHSEVMLTTCLYHHVFKIGDIGGTGEFTLHGYRNKYYVQGRGVNNGTMRWRPLYTMEEIEALGTNNKLFHPIK